MDIRIAGRYRLGRKIGGGSFGDIYIATDISSGDEVAVKLEHTKTKHPQLHVECKFYKVGSPGSLSRASSRSHSSQFVLFLLAGYGEMILRVYIYPVIQRTNTHLGISATKEIASYTRAVAFYPGFMLFREECSPFQHRLGGGTRHHMNVKSGLKKNQVESGVFSCFKHNHQSYEKTTYTYM